MSFNPDPSKQAVEVYFTRRSKPVDVPVVQFNNSPIAIVDSHKHLGLILDSKLSFDQHLTEKIAKANKIIVLISRLRKFLPRHSLLTIYKTFVRPHLDYGDIIYDYPNNATFTQNLESIQYRACLAITGCFQGTSREKLYSELGLESLVDRRFYRRLVFFYKIFHRYATKYLFDFIPARNTNLPNLRARANIYPFYTRTERFRNTFFPHSISEWNNLDSRIRNSPTISSFKNSILQFLRPRLAPIYGIQDSNGLVLLTRLRVGLVICLNINSDTDLTL